MGMTESKCWECANACTKGCSWSESFIQVEGWKVVDGCAVISCPEFIPERKPLQIDADIMGCRDLATGIVKMAIIDYVREKDARKRAALERFFRGEYFKVLSNIDPDVLMERLKEMKTIKRGLKEV